LARKEQGNKCSNLVKVSLSQDNAVSGAWRKLRELAAKEQDTAKLREIVVEINCLLNVIEIQLAKVEGGGKPTSH